MLVLLLLVPQCVLVTSAVIANHIREPNSSQNLDPKAGVHWIVAGKVAIRVTPTNFVATEIGDAFKVAHSVPVCDPFASSAPAWESQWLKEMLPA